MGEKLRRQKKDREREKSKDPIRDAAVINRFM